MGNGNVGSEKVREKGGRKGAEETWKMGAGKDGDGPSLTLRQIDAPDRN